MRSKLPDFNDLSPEGARKALAAAKRFRPAGDSGNEYPAPCDHVHGSTARWSEPLDIIGAPELVGFPTLTEDCLPEPLLRYVQSEARRLNADPCPIAAHVLAACASSIHGSWRIKPKKHDWWSEPAILAVHRSFSAAADIERDRRDRVRDLIREKVVNDASK